MSQTEYDKNGNVVEQLITEVTTLSDYYPDSFHTTFYYDSLNRIMEVWGQTLPF